MKRKKYTHPQSNQILLYPSHLLADSVKVDPDVDVDNSDKSISRDWGTVGFGSEEE